MKAGPESPSESNLRLLAPYAGWACLFLGLLLLDERGASRRVTGAGAGLVLIGAGLLLAEIRSSLKRRGRASFLWLLYSAAVVMACATIAGRWMPQGVPASHLQKSLREVFERRGTRFDFDFRGVHAVSHANASGWMDPDDEEPPHPIVFIGDSFLESRSSRNLAARVQDLLSGGGPRVGVLNLSKEDTEPDVEYRNRFYEFALRRAPSRIVLFLYAGNDYQASYQYRPYRPPSLFVTPTALTKGLAVSPEGARFLFQSYLRSEPVLSRQQISDAMPHSPEAVADLTYLAAMGYGAEQSAPLLSLRPGLQFGRALGQLLARLLVSAGAGAADPALSEAHARSAEPPAIFCVKAPWEQTWNDYQRLFAGPLDSEKRMAAIGRFIAERYCGFKDARPFQELLAAQSPEFREFVAWGADMPYVLFPAVAETLMRDPGDSWISTAEAQKAASEYALLVLEMANAARARGSEFSVVLIPEASAVDLGYRRFWQGMPRFFGHLRGVHWVHQALARQLEGRVDLIDLAASPQLLQDAYWPLDGHFNERGQAAVAQLLAERLRPR